MDVLYVSEVGGEDDGVIGAPIYCFWESFLKTLKFFATTFCSLLLALGMLSVVAFFYNYHTLSVRSDAGAFVGAYDPGSFVSNMAEGFGWNWMDERGFNNEKAIRHPDVLIMGPSHIFCEQLLKSQNVTYLLNHRLEDKTVYNTGISGNYIEFCVAYLDETCSYYQPSTIVLATHTLFPNEQTMRDDVAGVSHQSAYISDKGTLVRAIRKYIPATGLMLINLRNWRNFTAPTNRGGW